MRARDAGYALAAMCLEPRRAAALAERAPGGRGAQVRAILERWDREALRGRVAQLRAQPGAVLDPIHPSWIAARLLECDEPTQRAVIESLPPERREAVVAVLREHGVEPPAPAAARTEIARALDADRLERFRQRFFPELGQPVEPPRDPALTWLLAAPACAIMAAARELGLRVVARAFCRIGRAELAKLCHGLPAQDSVRLVGAVVELTERCDVEERKQLQYTHLKLLRAAGVSRRLFEDTGIAFIAAALVTQLEPVARRLLLYRLPEHLGRRLGELASEDMLPKATFVDVYREEAGPWLAELAQKGVIEGYEAS